MFRKIEQPKFETSGATIVFVIGPILYPKFYMHFIFFEGENLFDVFKVNCSPQGKCVFFISFKWDFGLN